jgi:predicted MFS family arabinose efflux permease
MTSSNSAPTTVRPSAREPASLPIVALLAFTVAGFLAIMTETMPAGLLPQISAGLGVSESLAGQLLTLYAIGSVVAAIPVIVATRGWRRRPLLLLAVGALFVFNAVTALSTTYGLTLVARFVAGMAAGVVWGLLAGYARRMVPEQVQGRALAIVGVGQPIALSLGVPIGSWLGGVFVWRGVFWIMAAVALALMVWIRAAVPDFPGQQAHQRQPIRDVLVLPGVRPILGVVLLWILGHNIIYTYIAPLLSGVGMGGRLVPVLLIFGLSAVAGIWVAGVFVDRYLRLLTLVCLAGFAASAIGLGLGTGAPLLVHLGVVAWGLTFGGAPTLLQTALADVAGEATDVAQSMLVTIFNLAVAGGGIVGGLLLEGLGSRSLPWAVLALAVAALGVAWGARGHGFRPGHRALS